MSLSQHRSKRCGRICSIALIQNTPQGVTVTRQVDYVQGSQRDLDLKYGWGLQWQAERK